METARVGVLGCGVMGSGIAQLCAMKGYNVVVCEKNEAMLEQGMGTYSKRIASFGKWQEIERRRC